MQIGKFKFLTKDEEKVATPEALILSHGRLVIGLARKFARYGADVEDLIQEGNLGLITAAEKFDPGMDVRFSTYAQFWVRQRMQEYVVAYCRIVRTPATPKNKRAFYGRQLSVDISMEKPLGEGLVFGDILPSMDPGPDEIVEKGIDGERLTAAIHKAVETLNPRLADILRSRYLKDEREGLETIGARMNISKERVRQLEFKAIEDIRRRISR